jgi:hypothetical protein
MIDSFFGNYYFAYECGSIYINLKVIFIDLQRIQQAICSADKISKLTNSQIKYIIE